MRDDAQLTRSWLSFRVGTSGYAVPLARVHEVVELAALTRLPLAPAAVLGVLDLRGAPLPVVDLGLRLGGADTPATRFSCVLVVDGPGGQVGLLVDRVDSLVELELELPPADAEAGGRREATVPGGRVRLLDLDEVLAREDAPARPAAEGLEP